MKFCILIAFIINMSFAQNDGYVDSTKVRNPKIAWKLGLIPGIGQMYNGKYIKAFSFITGEYIAVINFNKYKELGRIGLRNTYAWWIIGIYLWSLLDSYVDAQLSTFPDKRLDSFNEADSLRLDGN